MNKPHVSHDILNLLDRLRIMHDLIKREDYESIPKEEMKQDLEETLTKLNALFKEFIQ